MRYLDYDERNVIVSMNVPSSMRQRDQLHELLQTVLYYRVVAEA